MSEFDVSDIHGQLVFSYRHPHIPDGQETEGVAGVPSRFRGQWPDDHTVHPHNAGRMEALQAPSGRAARRHFAWRSAGTCLPPGLGRQGLLSQPSGDMRENVAPAQ